jgi:hypothetical protein
VGELRVHAIALQSLGHDRARYQRPLRNNAEEPDTKVVAWLDQQSRTSVWTRSITVLEIRFGLQIMATGKRRSALLQSFESLVAKMGDRIAPLLLAS